MRNLKKLLTGLTVPQQYVCVSLEDLHDPPQVFLSTGANGEPLNVTSNHLFLGYKPLLIGIFCPSSEGFLAMQDHVELRFIQKSVFEKECPANASNCVRSFLAKVDLKKIFSQKLDDSHFVLYQGYYAQHRFISKFHQFINRQREKVRKEAPNNVALPGNLYDQVRIAYAIPRIVSLITLSEGEKMNMFPTDLHGPLGGVFYVSSLRHGGEANKQVEKAKKLVLSFMPVSEYRSVYSLGKNHMRQMKGFSTFRLCGSKSKLLQLPLPASVLRYMELELFTSFDAGIHRIHIYKILHAEKVKDGATLAHIHQYYAQWRINRRLPLNMHLR
jgi:flavin reductase (DIM6/NTAB) family NADH-FMN oxidoreductase RutF